MKTCLQDVFFTLWFNSYTGTLKVMLQLGDQGKESAFATRDTADCLFGVDFMRFLHKDMNRTHKIK